MDNYQLWLILLSVTHVVAIISIPFILQSVNNKKEARDWKIQLLRETLAYRSALTTLTANVDGTDRRNKITDTLNQIYVAYDSNSKVKEAIRLLSRQFTVDKLHHLIYQMCLTLDISEPDRDITEHPIVINYIPGKVVKNETPTNDKEEP